MKLFYIGIMLISDDCPISSLQKLIEAESMEKAKVEAENLFINAVASVYLDGDNEKWEWEKHQDELSLSDDEMAVTIFLADDVRYRFVLTPA